MLVSCYNLRNEKNESITFFYLFRFISYSFIEKEFILLYNIDCIKMELEEIDKGE